MNWWDTFVLVFAGIMMATWMLGPPGTSGGLLLWHIYAILPNDRPDWFVSRLEAWFVKHPKDQYITLHGSVWSRAVQDIVEKVREGWTDEQVREAISGLFVATHNAGGTVDDVDHLGEILMSNVGATPDVTRH